jgi:Dehydrogenases with different specificities (related to short-chain alcohol dehydrogenases)
MQTLHGRVAVVVAASDGIGAAIARCFGEQGASVVVNCASDKAGAEQVVAEIVRSGGRAVAFQSDMANEADFRQCRQLRPPELWKPWLCLQQHARLSARCLRSKDRRRLSFRIPWILRPSGRRKYRIKNVTLTVGATLA